MKNSYPTNLYIALTHYPVINKNGNIIASAVTNLDLHDMSRAAKTYGVRSFYVVTPLADQRELVEKIVDHWVKGVGATYNPKRREALELIRIKNSLDEVADHIRDSAGYAPKTVVTSAKRSPGNISFDRFRRMLSNENLYLLIFGTAWGLTNDFMTGADYILDPVIGNTDYNHLSVRSATAVILDRLFGNQT
ncbi:MAG: RNA methyltransferase [Desulfobacteraceae bacterium]|nr:RNA methyltransferase [Desulfobacteraceae bacterium]